MDIDVGSELKAVQTIGGGVHAAGTKNGTGVDCQGFSEALIIVNAETVGSSGTIDIKVQESADNSTFADITGAAFTQIVASNDDAIYQGRVKLTPTRKRYLRAVAVVAVASCDFGVSVVLGGAVQLPAATPEFNIDS